MSRVVVKGPFEILEIRATGAFGTVCRARRTGDPLERTVGLKVLKGTLVNSPQILSRTRDEARLLSKLRHPNIVGVEELLSYDKRPVIVMEWVDGLSLRQVLDAGSPFPTAAALEVVRRAARALDDAWNGTASQDGTPLRIVHRDIKPENLLLSLHGEVKVVDFGVSRGEFVERETTTVSTILGAQGYMAPERLAGVPDSPAVDVYSLGIALLELLTARMPVLPRVQDGHPVALAHHLERMRLADVPADVGARVGVLIADCAAWDPVMRPTARELHARIRAVQDAERLSTDLVEFARNRVAPLAEAWPHLDPHDHPAWPDVAFLEDPNAVPGPGAATGTPTPDRVTRAHQADAAEADRRLRDFLAQPGWEQKRRELKWLLALHPQWTADPLLDVLRHADPPWWQPWARAARPEQVALVLDVLKHRRTPEVLDVVRPLARARDVRVADAAKQLLGHGEE